MYLCVLCGSENKQRLFLYTALTDWFYNWDGECLLRGTDWVFKYNTAVFIAEENRIPSRTNPFEIFDGQSDTGKDFLPTASVIRSQFHSTNGPYILVFIYVLF